MLFCAIKGLHWHYSWRLWRLPLVQTYTRGSITIGKDFVACSDPRHNSIGVFQHVVLKTLRPEAKIAIGENVGVSGAAISAAEKITIGNNVLIGSGALIIDSDLHPVSAAESNCEGSAVARPVIIEDDVFIGARAILLKGVHIGRGATVGAGSVVPHDVPPSVVVGGNPARVIGRKRKNIQ